MVLKWKSGVSDGAIRLATVTWLVRHLQDPVFLHVDVEGLHCVIVGSL